MTKRTAADFAREAPTDGEWTFELTSKKTVSPRARSQFTFDEGLAEAHLTMAWASRSAAMRRGEPDPGEPESPFHFDLKVRLSAPNVYVESRERAKASGEPVDVELPEYDAFWAEVKHWPLDSICKLIVELDEYYPPAEPASDQERSDADGDPAGDAAGKSGSASTS